MSEVTVRYNEILSKIIYYLDEPALSMAKSCASLLWQKLPYQDNLPLNKILVAYGGGKDSSYMLTYVRLLQLLIYKEKNATFFLRVITNRHVGMSDDVISKIYHVF